MTNPIPEQIQSALRRYANGKASPEDHQLINAWNSSFDDGSPLPDEIESALGQMGLTIHERLIKAIHAEQLSDGLHPAGQAVASERTPRIPAYQRKWIAAATILLAITATWLLIRQDHTTTAMPATAPIASILPGSSKAILTLSDGKQIRLDTTAGNTITDANDIKIDNLNSGQITYATATSPHNNTTLYNTLTTPRGGQFRVFLPDGSLAWLNAASTIRYPLTFTGATRDITLTGEAWFEIKQDAHHPFRVQTNRGEVEVLGTSFNIMAYDDEPAQQMTLVTGSIRVADTRNSAKTILTPGQQTSLPETAATDRLSITRPDLGAVLAWKNGEIRYDGVKINTIMRQVARWYDVEISYQGPLPPTEFAGSVSRLEDIKDLLSVLEDTHSVHFIIEGKKITVIAGPLVR